MAVHFMWYCALGPARLSQHVDEDDIDMSSDDAHDFALHSAICHYLFAKVGAMRRTLFVYVITANDDETQLRVCRA